LDIGNLNEFTVGFKEGVEVFIGEEFDKRTCGLPFVISHSPYTVSIELGFRDPALFDMTVQTFNMFKEMALSMVPDGKKLLRYGLDIQMRLEGNRVFIDGIVGGIIAALIDGLGVRTDTFKFSTLLKFFISTALSPIMAVDKTLEELITAALQLKIYGNLEIFNVGNLTALIDAIIFELKGKHSKKLKLAAAVYKIFKSSTVEVKWDSLEGVNVIKDFANVLSPNGWNEYSEQVMGLQMMLGGFIEQGKSFVMFIADYIALIKNLDLDVIKVHALSQHFRAGATATLELPGFTAFVNEKFLSEC